MRLFKRGLVWFCAVYDAGGRRHRRSTRCHDRRAAEVVARKWEQAAADPAGAAQASATVEDALSALLELRREEAAAGKRSSATVDYYEDKAGVLVRLLGADAPLVGLTAARLDRAVTERRVEKASDHSIHKELGVLRVALKLAKRRGLWRGDVEEIIPRISPGYTPRARVLSYAELPQLLAELEPDDAARTALCVATTAEAGATGRALDDDVRAHEVLVRGTKRESRWRVVPLVTPWQRQLVEYALRHAQGKDGKLFARGLRAWAASLERVARKLELGHVSPNDLRRTGATWLRASGAPVELLSPVLGHTDGRMAERVYARLSPTDLARRLAESVGEKWDTGGTDGCGTGPLSGFGDRLSR